MYIMDKVILARRVVTCLLAVLPLVAGTLSARLGTKDGQQFSKAQSATVWFSPPSIVFSIVWPMLFVLMGTSFAMITWNLSRSSQDVWRFVVAVALLIVNIALNVTFPLVQFESRDLRAGLIVTWLNLFAATVTLSTFIVYVSSSKDGKSDGRGGVLTNIAIGLWVPYVLWLMFAAVLSSCVYRKSTTDGVRQ